MATIEKRSGKTKTSYRVIWRHDNNRYAETFSSLEKAEAWVRLLKFSNNDPVATEKNLRRTESTVPTLSEISERYIGNLIDTADYTRTKYRTYMRHHLHVIDHPVDTIGEEDIARWVAWMHREGKGGKGYAPKTIKNTHGYLSSLLRYAVKLGHITWNPTEETRIPKMTPGSERNKFLTEEEFFTVLGHVEDQFRPYAVFLFYTGLRGSEMLALTPEDFTVADGMTYVSVTKSMKRAETGPGTYVGEPKSESSRRRIDVDDDTMSVVWPLVRAAGHGNYVFPVEPIQEVTVLYRRMWRPAVKRAQKAGFTKTPKVHSLRHSHASHMLALGQPMHEVSRRLGHSSLAMTDKVYAHMVPARQGSASKLLQQSKRSQAVEHAPAELTAHG
ncbi:site-specific integrase [Nesterenkonia pannonica]|uniref:tyrosine-type recombinase/integrase n=1 Tax=Nesterenkonia pannonica TaxID=1548602 RepID=UPI00216437DE|nr:site-specific integrase [Nesterenkonia pannonica]